MPCNLSRTALVAVLASLASFAMHAQDSQQQETYNPVTYEEIENPDPTEWLMWRRTQNHWGYSPLDQINKELLKSFFKNTVDDTYNSPKQYLIKMTKINPNILF